MKEIEYYDTVDPDEEGIRNVVRASVAKSNKKPSKTEIHTRRVVATGLAVGLGLIAGKALIGGNSGSAPEGKFGDVPQATINYLEGLPTQTATIPEGGGADNAAYQVDPTTYDESASIHEGIKAIINAQVPHNQGTPIPQAGEKVQVPIVPGLGSVPPVSR